MSGYGNPMRLTNSAVLAAALRGVRLTPAAHEFAETPLLLVEPGEYVWFDELAYWYGFDAEAKWQWLQRRRAAFPSRTGSGGRREVAAAVVPVFLCIAFDPGDLPPELREGFRAYREETCRRFARTFRHGDGAKDGGRG